MKRGVLIDEKIYNENLVLIYFELLQTKNSLGYLKCVKHSEDYSSYIIKRHC